MPDNKKLIEKIISIQQDNVSRTHMPTIALRGLVVFPDDSVHVDIGRERSFKAVELAMQGDKSVFLLTQKGLSDEITKSDELYNIGVIARVRQILKISDSCTRVLVEGISRAKAENIDITDDCIKCDTTVLFEKKSRAAAVYKEALVRKIHKAFEKLASFIPKMPADIKTAVLSNSEPGLLADYIISNLPVPTDDKQFVLEQLNPVKRLETVLDILNRELQICSIDSKIGEKTKELIDENQREYYLREQLHAINNELYGEDDPDSEIEGYYEKIDKITASDDVKDILRDEVKKLSKMPQGAHESTVVRVYLDTCLSLPWGVKTKLSSDIERSRKILDRDHYGLKKVKERILESIAVFGLKYDAKGHIICLAGPPGVGKTSIAKSLALCMGRNFERVSLGGVHDEAEIRGHRKTYIGSMPGKIMKAVISAKSSNPLILLDEIDKLGDDYKGDPASALLEVLDSEQNNTFTDHYIDMPFDLSKVFFVTTANNINEIPSPLLDRMEIIEIPGYTREDKYYIASKHLIKKQMEQNGLKPSMLRVDKKVYFDIADYYTREAGVRNMERTIAKICRKSAKLIVSGDADKVSVTSANLKDFLGIRKFSVQSLLDNDEVGIVNGLAWTSVGGEIMQLEASAVDGTGKIELTGSLGDVMKESAMAAVSFIRSNASVYGIDTEFYKKCDIHIHATEAAVPKDGPSAGVTMVVAVLSALTGIPIRRDVAMTGEVTIKGRVLPIGGLSEKAMAAYRAGIKTVIIPKQNVPDLEDVDNIVKENISFIYAERVEQVLATALTKIPKPGNNCIAVPTVSVAKSNDAMLTL